MRQHNIIGRLQALTSGIEVTTVRLNCNENKAKNDSEKPYTNVRAKHEVIHGPAVLKMGLLAWLKR